MFNPVITSSSLLFFTKETSFHTFFSILILNIFTFITGNNRKQTIKDDWNRYHLLLLFIIIQLLKDYIYNIFLIETCNFLAKSLILLHFFMWLITTIFLIIFQLFLMIFQFFMLQIWNIAPNFFFLITFFLTHNHVFPLSLNFPSNISTFFWLQLTYVCSNLLW